MTPRSKIWLARLLMALAIPQATLAAGIYQSNTYTPLTSDFRSFHVGDLLTVIIVESATAQSSATSSQSRDFGLTGTGQLDSAQHSIGGTLNRQSNNNGSTERKGSLQAELSVRVQSVAANGDLVLHGAQTILVNGEEQRIQLSGVARPIDVSADNVVLSTRLSNAQIEYVGRGFVDRSQRQGLISRFLDYLGL